jgi:phospholipase/lecithinase/hemolysin
LLPDYVHSQILGLPYHPQRLRGSEDHVPLVQSLVDSLLSNSAHLHNIGARHFLLLTAVPIELTPEASLPDHGGYTDRHLTGSDARLFNHLLRKGATEWEERCGDCNVMVFDLEIYLRLIRRWPEGFGLTDTTAFEKTIGDIRQERGKMGFM